MTAPKTRAKPASKAVNLMDLAADGAQVVLLRGVLRACEWNLSRAAVALGLSHPSEVRRYIVRLGMGTELDAAKAAGMAKSGKPARKTTE